VVLRPSGTQPYLRIMVESEDPARCAATADGLERALVEIAQTVAETG
jgi:phosphomannomutase